MLLRHRRQVAIGGFILSEGYENHLVRLTRHMADQLDEGAGNLGPNLPLPVFHQGVEGVPLSRLERGMSDGPEHGSSPRWPSPPTPSPSALGEGSLDVEMRRQWPRDSTS